LVLLPGNNAPKLSLAKVSATTRCLKTLHWASPHHGLQRCAIYLLCVLRIGRSAFFLTTHLSRCLS
jgi:hypothetical protein